MEVLKLAGELGRPSRNQLNTLSCSGSVSANPHRDKPLSMLMYDGIYSDFRNLLLPPKSPQCKVCGQNPVITADSFFDISGLSDHEVSLPPPSLLLAHTVTQFLSSRSPLSPLSLPTSIYIHLLISI
jgi:hypothetical protein